MATASDVAAALVAVLRTDLAEVDQSSTSGFLPLVPSSSVALVATALGHQDIGYVYSAGWMHVVHRFRMRFFVKHVNGQESTTVQRARDVGYRAMRALVAHDGTGYTLSAGDNDSMVSEILPEMVEVGGQPYVLVTLTVACYQKENV